MEKPFAIVVTFNPDVRRVMELISKLETSLIFPVIVDNSSVCGLAKFEGQLIALGENTGIAHAQNIGIQYCLKNGATSILFFDQDSLVTSEMLGHLLQDLKPGGALIAAPVYFDERKNFYYPITRVTSSGLVRKVPATPQSGRVTTNMTISSGTGAKAEVFYRIGLLDEDFFIDYVDTEWTLRCARAGIFVTINPLAIMQHSIGDATIDLKVMKILVHNPSRRYFRIRNTFLLFRKPAVPFLFACREILIVLIQQAILLVLHSQRMAHLYFLRRGVVDGLLGRCGKQFSRRKVNAAAAEGI